jgi:hypothetical protein
MDELAQMENDYQAAGSSLFPGGTNYRGSGSNPFIEALGYQSGLSGGSQGGNTDSGNTGGDNGGGGDNSGGGSSGGEGGGDPGGNPGGGGNNPPPNPPPGGPGENDFENRFLVVGQLDESNPLDITFQAVRDIGGNFTLDNGQQLSLVSGVVGFSRPYLLLNAREQLTSGDFGRDRRMDYFIVRPTDLGSAVEGYRFPGGDLRQWAAGFFLYDLVRSVALFDYNGDGVDELVVAFVKNPHLVIYQISGGEFSYLRELTLPFAPAVLATTHDSGPSGTEYLQVFDEPLELSVTFNSRYAGVYTFSRPPTFRDKRLVTVESISGNSTRTYRLVWYKDRLVLVQSDLGSAGVLVNLDLSAGFPTVIVGDYESNNKQQVLVLP